jgi:hypothetical protein
LENERVGEALTKLFFGPANRRSFPTSGEIRDEAKFLRLSAKLALIISSDRPPSTLPLSCIARVVGCRSRGMELEVRAIKPVPGKKDEEIRRESSRFLLLPLIYLPQSFANFRP